jgi:hypothetical protein
VVGEVDQVIYQEPLDLLVELEELQDQQEQLIEAEAEAVILHPAAKV